MARNQKLRSQASKPVDRCQRKISFYISRPAQPITNLPTVEKNAENNSSSPQKEKIVALQKQFNREKLENVENLNSAETNSISEHFKVHSKQTIAVCDSKCKEEIESLENQVTQEKALTILLDDEITEIPPSPKLSNKQGNLSLPLRLVKKQPIATENHTFTSIRGKRQLNEASFPIPGIKRPKLHNLKCNQSTSELTETDVSFKKLLKIESVAKIPQRVDSLKGVLDIESVSRIHQGAKIPTVSFQHQKTDIEFHENVDKTETKLTTKQLSELKIKISHDFIKQEFITSPVKCASNISPNSATSCCSGKSSNNPAGFTVLTPKKVAVDRSNSVTISPKSSSNDLNWLDDDFNFDLEELVFKGDSSKEIEKIVPQLENKLFKIKGIEKQLGCVTLKLSSPVDDHERLCLLKGFWTDMEVELKDSVTVIAYFNESGLAVVDNDNGFLILHPDILVSSTAVSSTLFCLRKSVLAERFRGWDPGNEAMFLGNIIHELFQKCLVLEPKGISDLKVELAKILQSKSHLQELYGLGLSMNKVIEKSFPYLNSIFNWIKQYQSISPTPLCKDKCSSEDVLVTVTDVQDIEENIWCTKFGVKGKIDVTVQVNIHKRGKKENKTVPLELKTGKASFSNEHQGQVILYSLMMSERMEAPGGGLLLYLSEGPQMKFIEATHHKKRGLIQLRNELAYYFRYMTKSCESRFCVLPEPINQYKFCSSCSFNLPCTLLERAIESQEKSKNRQGLVTEITQHLTPEHCTYFKNWYKMLHLEMASQYERDHGKSFWIESAASREDMGKCFDSLNLTSSTGDKVDNFFCHTFERRNKRAKLLTKVGLSSGESVVISSMTSSSEIALAFGNIISISESCVMILLDKDLHNRKNFNTELFRIDLNSTLSQAANFKNLATLMKNNSDSEKLRRLVIDKTEPVFQKGLSRDLAVKLKPYLKILNVPQQRAVLKLLMAEDYMLLHGMPGTGKTSTIVALVQVLIKLGFSVLLTSYTHSAVDNILLKLKKYDVRFVRLGRISRIHPDIKDFSADFLTKDISSVEGLSAFYSSMPVVATTCLALNHPLFKQKRFDFCIVDEASQILQTTCIGPLFHSKIFILVGDSKQLPPVSSSKVARSQGLTESLFSRLESTACTFDLNIQYRMNKEIMRICNTLTYKGKLVCGSEDIASATIMIKQEARQDLKPWAERALSSDLSSSVIFLNMDSTSTSELFESASVSNQAEVNIVFFLVRQFVSCGFLANKIGVISFYNKQVQLLKAHCQILNVEVNTVDQFQGRDKSAVIISCVRNSQVAVLGEILQDERRLNVAITRAQHKLIVVGSQNTLRKYTPFLNFFNCLHANQKVDISKSDYLTVVNSNQDSLSKVLF